MSEKEREEEGAGLRFERVLEVAGRQRGWVAGLTALGLTLAVGWAATRAPVYRARATLILEDENATGGVLGELAALTQAPRAESEMELLKARTTAETVVSAARAADDALDAAQEPGGFARRLGLATLVEDPRRAPLAALLGGIHDLPPEPSPLTARVDGLVGTHPINLRVEFEEDGRVRLAPGGLRARVGLAALDPLVTEWRPGAPIEYAGLRVTLESRAERSALAGRSFVLRAHSDADAVQRVLDRTRVRETARNAGVIEVLFDDSDPVRAADTVNALCQNYLDRNQLRGRRRASETLGFIDAQLQEQRDALEDAEREVAALQSENPRTVDVGAVGQALIAEHSALEVRRVQARLLQSSLRQALERLENGDVESLSRLSFELGDPIGTSYVDGIARLRAQAALLGTSNAGEFKAALQQRALELEGVAAALDLRADLLERTRAAIEEGDERALARIGGEELQNDPLLAGYLAELAAQQARQALLARTATEEHPDWDDVARALAELRTRVLATLGERQAALDNQREAFEGQLVTARARTDGFADDERARIETAIVGLVALTREHLQARLGGLLADEETLGAEIEGLAAAIGSLPEEQRALADPLRRVSAHGEIVQFLLGRRQEAEIARASTMASAEFIDPAVPPLAPRGPSVPLHALGGALLGLAAGLAVAFARQALTRGVESAAELESMTGLPVFGAVPDHRRGPRRVRHAGKRFVPLRDDPGGPLAEAHRSLRANLKFALAGDDVRTLACTSCAPGEGKSMTNLGLALAFAASSKRVLLVDADMRKPSLAATLHLDLEPGFSDVLEQRVAWREALRRDVAPNLDVLTSGRRPESPGDLLEGGVCERFLAEVREEYDLVVLDVPPAMAVADTDNLAARLDAVILVCRSRTIPATVVGAAAQRLRQVGARLVGAVLNATAPTSGEGKYGYGYGYGYGEPDHKPERPRRRERVAG